MIDYYNVLAKRFEYSEQHLNYFVFEQPEHLMDLALVTDLDYVDDYLRVFDYNVEDYYHPESELEYAYREKGTYKLIQKSFRNDTSLSCVYTFTALRKTTKEPFRIKIFLILPKFPHVISRLDLDIVERTDSLYYCNMFYMTFEPIRKEFRSKTQRFIEESHLILKGTGTDKYSISLPGQAHQVKAEEGGCQP